MEYHVKELEANRRDSQAEARGSDAGDATGDVAMRTRPLRQGTIANTQFNVQDVKMINDDLQKFAKKVSIDSDDSVRQRRLDEIGKGGSRNKDRDADELTIQRRHTQHPETDQKLPGKPHDPRYERSASAIERADENSGDLVKRPVAGLKDE